MKQNKTKTIAVRVTEGEYQFLEDKAHNQGVKISQLLRKAVKVAPPDRIVPKVNRVTYQRLGEIQQLVEELESSQLKNELLDRVITLRREMSGHQPSQSISGPWPSLFLNY